MKRYAAPGLVATLFAGALFIHLDAPFLRHREGVGAQYAIMARNFVRIGTAETRLGLYETAAPDLSVYREGWRRYEYPNRPPLSVLATSLWFRLLGGHERTLRLSLIVAALGTLLAFLALARRLLEERWAVLAMACLAFNPMFWYFSGTIVHLVYSLCFSVAAWACRVRWNDARRYRVLTCVFLFLACESDWPGYFAVFSIALDAVLSKERAAAAGMIGMALACFGLHLLHLLWVDPAHGPLVKKFLAMGGERTAQGLPSFPAYLKSEGREFGLYFTIGGLALAAVGVRRLSRSAWLLALLGLEEIVFMHWAYVHDFLSYSLAPFFSLAAAKGVETLWVSRPKRIGAVALAALASVQSAVIMQNRLTRFGAYEVYYRAGLAIHDVAGPLERVLLTITDVRQYTPYYADRYTAAMEDEQPLLMVHPSGPREPASGVEDLGRFFPKFDWVLVGDPDRAAEEIRFFNGGRPPESFRFLDAAHPLRRKLEEIAVEKRTHGAFVLYRLTRPDTRP